MDANLSPERKSMLMDHNGANGQPNVTDTYFDIVVMKNMFSSPVEHDVTGFLSAKHQSKNYYTMVKQVKKKKTTTRAVPCVLLLHLYSSVFKQLYGIYISC